MLCVLCAEGGSVRNGLVWYRTKRAGCGKGIVWFFGFVWSRAGAGPAADTAPYRAAACGQSRRAAHPSQRPLPAASRHVTVRYGTAQYGASQAGSSQ